ncbi:MAG: hypothetical protein R3E31_20510 [Chloroflexota bacterium]
MMSSTHPSSNPLTTTFSIALWFNPDSAGLGIGDARWCSKQAATAVVVSCSSWTAITGYIAI